MLISDVLLRKNEKRTANALHFSHHPEHEIGPINVRRVLNKQLPGGLTG